tara:strand:+ start:4257 stop:4433 length:177 start_codon:yes stop_codon:yes gene_type:complete
VKRKINPNVHKKGVIIELIPHTIVDNQLNTFIPVGIAIIIVALVKYALVSMSIPTVYI